MSELDIDAHRAAWAQAAEGERAFYVERPAVFSPAAAAQDAANRSRMLWNWAPIWLPWEYTSWLEEGRSFHDTAYIGDWSGASNLAGRTMRDLILGGSTEHALLAAGEEFGLRRGGALACYTGSIESGYMAPPTSAVYTREHMKAYREWLPGDGYEGTLSICGSYRSEDIEDYYVTPYDFGYGHLVRFDRDFIGRSALEQVADHSHRKKVWLRWNDEDVARVYASSLFGHTRPPTH
jgi:hypothetical protein